MVIIITIIPFPRVIIRIKYVMLKALSDCYYLEDRNCICPAHHYISSIVSESGMQMTPSMSLNEIINTLYSKALSKFLFDFCSSFIYLSLSRFKFKNVFYCHKCSFFQNSSFVLMQVSKSVNNLIIGNLCMYWTLYTAVPFIPHNQQYNGTTRPSWHMRKHSPRG